LFGYSPKKKEYPRICFISVFLKSYLPNIVKKVKKPANANPKVYAIAIPYRLKPKTDITIFSPILAHIHRVKIAVITFNNQKSDQSLYTLLLII
jgi:hypothetical protein